MIRRDVGTQMKSSLNLFCLQVSKSKARPEFAYVFNQLKACISSDGKAHTYISE